MHTSQKPWSDPVNPFGSSVPRLNVCKVKGNVSVRFTEGTPDAHTTHASGYLIH